MFDATKLLGSMMQSRATPSAGGRLDRAVQGSGGGPLQDLLAQFGGGGGGQQSGGLGGLLGGLFGGGSRSQGGSGGMLGGIGDMVQRAANSPGQEVSRNNPAAVGGLGALAGALLGGGRGAVGGGLMAVLGSLAYSAMQRQGQDQGQAEGETATPVVAPATAYANAHDVQRKALLMLRAMIQAAKADGQIDGAEMNRITGKLDEAGEDHEARDFVLKEMRGPVDLDGLARDVRSPQEGAEIYAASLMAIEVDASAERDYLARLAQALGLAAPAVAHIHERLGVKA